MRGKGTKLGDGCPKVRLFRIGCQYFSPHLAYSEGERAKLGEHYPKVWRDGGISVNVWDFYEFRDCYVRDNYVVPNIRLVKLGPVCKISI